MNERISSEIGSCQNLLEKSEIGNWLRADILQNLLVLDNVNLRWSHDERELYAAYPFLSPFICDRQLLYLSKFIWDKGTGADLN